MLRANTFVFLPIQNQFFRSCFGTGEPPEDATLSFAQNDGDVETLPSSR